MGDLVNLATMTETVIVPKELDEVLIAIEDLVTDLKAGKSVAEIASTRFAEITRAFDGLDQIPSEAKTLPFEAAAAGTIHGLRIVRVLMGV